MNKRATKEDQGYRCNSAHFISLQHKNQLTCIAVEQRKQTHLDSAGQGPLKSGQQYTSAIRQKTEQLTLAGKTWLTYRTEF